MNPTTSTNTTPLAFTTAPPFVRAVYEMLQNEDQRILSWSADGSHFHVFDVPRLETEVLRKYFKHGKFSSFQRQLNNFGFHKWTKTRASVATFSHDVLVSCHLSQLDILVTQMKLKQKTARPTLVSTATSTKRPRRLLSTGTTTEHKVDVKRQKMSPRDVYAVYILPDVRFTSVLESLWLLQDDGNYNSTNDMLLLDLLDSVDLAALDWDGAMASPLEAVPVDLDDNCDNDKIDIDFDIDANTCRVAGLELSFGVEIGGEADAAVGDLVTPKVLADCDLDALLGDTLDVHEVDTLLFV